MCPPPCRLLSIGDSLTKGAVVSENRNAPYLQFTKEALLKALGACYDVEATVAGGRLWH